MTKLIDNDNDDASSPETPYQGRPRPVSTRATGLSLWSVLIVALAVLGLGAYFLTHEGSHTDPAPYGAINGTTPQPAPTQNSR